VKNMSRKFATMTDEERQRFAQEQGESAAGEDNEEAADEVEIEDPRDADRTGRQYPSVRAEVADADARDGEAALLDDRSHERAVASERARRRSAKSQGRRPEP
jgi:hypothetical protein